jgi:hypothetical protein
MKKHIALILTLTLLAGAAGYAAPPKVVSVAVFDFESKDENVRDLGAKIATLINANLSADPQLVTVEREELNKVVGEQEMSLSGTVSPDSAAKVGQLTGAKVLVTGRVFKAENDLILVAKIIGVETGRVYGEIVKGNASGSVADLSEELAKKISKTVAEKGDTLTVDVMSREERLKKIIDSVKGEKRPSVSVKIGERHFGAAVIDPAAETELSYLLQKAGFTVVDDKSDKKPDVEITGEAFSAFGMRKGNLISCRSRLELKAQERRDGKILLVDRQTSVAVDIAEQSAAKTALQNAADDLAERLLSALAK